MFYHFFDQSMIDLLKTHAKEKLETAARHVLGGRVWSYDNGGHMEVVPLIGLRNDGRIIAADEKRCSLYVVDLWDNIDPKRGITLATFSNTSIFGDQNNSLAGAVIRIAYSKKDGSIDWRSVASSLVNGSKLYIKSESEALIVALMYLGETPDKNVFVDLYDQQTIYAHMAVATRKLKRVLGIPPMTSHDSLVGLAVTNSGYTRLIYDCGEKVHVMRIGISLQQCIVSECAGAGSFSPIRNSDGSINWIESIKKYNEETAKNSIHDVITTVYAF